MQGLGKFIHLRVLRPVLDAGVSHDKVDKVADQAQELEGKVQPVFTATWAKDIGDDHEDLRAGWAFSVGKRRWGRSG